jgi:uncharacterized protein YodC (DUF2158 family)
MEIPLEADLFVPGDLVRLKSGGPVMTVCKITPYGVEAMWFAYGQSHDGRFAPAALELAPGPDKHVVGTPRRPRVEREGCSRVNDAGDPGPADRTSGIGVP